jgi:hypothetical protein
MPSEEAKNSQTVLGETAVASSFKKSVAVGFSPRNISSLLIANCYLNFEVPR